MSDPNTIEGDDELEALVASFLEERRSGRDPSIEDYAARLSGRERQARLVLKALVALEPYEPGSRGPRTPQGAAEALANRPPGERLGAYRIVREVGRGGMGVVYEAIQEPLGRRVALKLLRPGMLESSADLQRFRREAELASKLDHPGVCTVYETGFEGGMPFIAMRFLDGETLAQKIARRRDEAGPSSSTVIRLDEVRARMSEATPGTPSGGSTAEIARVVRVIERAARALHAAHEAGVVHRDVKPGNILVTREGDPVVLDFGLARGAEPGTTLTHSGELCGTPAYLSPEQIAGTGMRPDRQSDVYALGVTLFECLTLRRPFEAATREALYRTILTAEPADVRALNQAVTVDLKAIVDTALEKDRGRRYATAAELADDLSALLALRPVRARPLGPLRRLARAARRNPGTTAAIALTVLALVGGPLAYAIQQARARAELGVERDRADANYREARAAVEGMLERIAAEHMEESPDLQPMRQRILESALDFYRRFVAINRGDPGVQRETAEAFRRIGSILEDLGHVEEARISLGESIVLLDQLIAQEPSAHGLLRDRAHTHGVQASVFRSLGRLDQAERSHQLGIADLESLAAGGKDETRSLELAAQFEGLALVLGEVGREAEAESYHRSALELVRALPEAQRDGEAVRDVRARSSNHLGQLLVRTGRLAEGEALLMTAREEFARLAAEAPDASSWAFSLVGTDKVLADLWQATGRHGDAEAALLEAIAQLEGLAARHPGRPAYRERLADLLSSLAALLDERERSEESEAAYRKELEIHRELAASYPAMGYAEGMGRCLANLGWAIWERLPAEAERCYREALEIQEPEAAARSTEPEFLGAFANTWDLLGSLLYEQKRLDEAEVAQRRALDLRTALVERWPDVPANASDLGGLLTNLTRTVRDRGDPCAALALIDESIVWQSRALERNPDHPIYRWFLRLAHTVRTETCLRMGAHAQAATSARTLHAIFPERARDWHLAARLLARCATLARLDAGLEPAQREELAIAYENEAIECLRTAAERGWRDATELEKAAAFESLRARADYGAIAALLRSPSPSR